jgi:hypothetical protein
LAFPIIDDGTGTDTTRLSGADASLFQIGGNNLELWAGVTLDFATNPALDVTIRVEDAVVPSLSDIKVFTILVNNALVAAPTGKTPRLRGRNSRPPAQLLSLMGDQLRLAAIEHFTIA